MLINTETPCITSQCAEKRLQCTVLLMGCLSHTPSLKAQRYMQKRRWKTIVRTVAMDIIKQRAFSRHSSADAQTNSETMKTCARTSQTEARQSSSMEERKWAQRPTPSTEAICDWYLLGDKRWVFFKGVYQSCSRESLLLWNRWPCYVFSFLLKEKGPEEGWVGRSGRI